MIIRIEFYPEAKDGMDIPAVQPTRVYHARTIEEAMMAIGTIERHENIPPVEITDF